MPTDQVSQIPSKTQKKPPFLFYILIAIGILGLLIFILTKPISTKNFILAIIISAIFAGVWIYLHKKQHMNVHQVVKEIHETVFKEGVSLNTYEYNWVGGINPYYPDDTVFFVYFIKEARLFHYKIQQGIIATRYMTYEEFNKEFLERIVLSDILKETLAKKQRMEVLERYEASNINT